VFPRNFFGPVGIPGPESYTLKFCSNPPTNTIPIPGASVWVTSDSAGRDIIAGPALTDIAGEVSFVLSSGIYSVWMTKAGYTPIRGAILTVD
jgi:hypothetical protein